MKPAARPKNQPFEWYSSIFFKSANLIYPAFCNHWMWSIAIQTANQKAFQIAKYFSTSSFTVKAFKNSFVYSKARKKRMTERRKAWEIGGQFWKCRASVGQNPSSSLFLWLTHFYGSFQCWMHHWQDAFANLIIQESTYKHSFGKYKVFLSYCDILSEASVGSGHIGMIVTLRICWFNNLFVRSINLWSYMIRCDNIECRVNAHVCSRCSLPAELCRWIVLYLVRCHYSSSRESHIYWSRQPNVTPYHDQ